MKKLLILALVLLLTGCGVTEIRDVGAEADSWTSAAQEHIGGEENAEDYVLNVSSRKYHLPDCASVAEMAEYNRQNFHGTKEDLERMGYTPCSRCLPG